MSLFEAILLGIIQGLTEFLPVSSSGHLEIGHYLFGLDTESSFAFTLTVHGATVLSTIVVFRRDIADLARGALRLEMNAETRYLIMILISMVPVGIVGLLFKDLVESLFTGNIVFVGFMLLVTACLLFVTRYFQDRGKEISGIRALIIGVAQAFAVLPGISRSGATIATGMMLGISREKIAAFSFLMVIAPIIGANILELANRDVDLTVTDYMPLLIGFLAAFGSGYFACRVMISLVKRSKLIWFSVYCTVMGLSAIFIF